jgi:hypothetical protein
MIAVRGPTLSARLVATSLGLSLIWTCGLTGDPGRDGGSSATQGSGTGSFRVFVTSLWWTTGEGVETADTFCEQAALAAGLTGEWMAWISTDSMSAADRLVHATVPYTLVDGTVIADDWQDLITCDGPDGECLQHAISMTENGDDFFGFVFTGTLTDGSQSIGDNCNDWGFNGNGKHHVALGNSDAMNYRWTAQEFQTACFAARLYCFEQPSSCPWDLNGNGGVDITDFLQLLSEWGSDPGGPPDFDGNGAVDIGDFLELLSNWGVCP